MKNKGQAIAELAIFGSILLFCASILVQYAIDANYQQSTQMEAFRKALKIAFYKGGPGAPTSLVLIKDKPLPDTRDQFGFPERYPAAASGSVTWDTNLSANYVKSFSETPTLESLPTGYFEVDKISNLADVQTDAAAQVPPDAGEDNAFGFVNARFDRADCPDTITVVAADPAHTSGREYTSATISKNDIKVMLMEGGFGDSTTDADIADDTELLMSPYYRDAQLVKHKIVAADLDGDGKLEMIVAANNAKQFLYITYHDPANSPTSPNTVVGAIQMDSDYAGIRPGDKILVGGVYRDPTPNDRQGFLGDFQKTIQHTGSSIWKAQVLGGTLQRTNLNATQQITHKIRLNGGRVIDVKADFVAPATNLYNW